MAAVPVFWPARTHVTPDNLLVRLLKGGRGGEAAGWQVATSRRKALSATRGLRLGLRNANPQSTTSVQPTVPRSGTGNAANRKLPKATEIPIAGTENQELPLQEVTSSSKLEDMCGRRRCPHRRPPPRGTEECILRRQPKQNSFVKPVHSLAWLHGGI